MNLIKELANQGYIFPIQAIILLINGYLIYTYNDNGCVILSSIMITSTFVLQAVRRRFFMFHPRNSDTGRESALIDTWYLRLIIIGATFFALMGWSNSSIGDPVCFNFVRNNILPIGLVFIIIIPLIFFFSSKYIDEKIADKLIKYGPNKSCVPCRQRNQLC